MRWDLVLQFGVIFLIIWTLDDRGITLLAHNWAKIMHIYSLIPGCTS